MGDERIEEREIWNGGRVMEKERKREIKYPMKEGRVMEEGAVREERVLMVEYNTNDTLTQTCSLWYVFVVLLLALCGPRSHIFFPCTSCFLFLFVYFIRSLRNTTLITSSSCYAFFLCLYSLF